MQFQPKTEAEIAMMGCLPAGTYDFEVLTAVDTTSKSTGKPMMKVELKVFAGEREKKVTDYLMESMAYKLIHFARVIGMEADYNAGGLDPTAVVGRCGRVTLKIEEQPGFMPKNAVKDYASDDKKPAEAAAPKAAFVAQASAATDEPPF